MTARIAVVGTGHVGSVVAGCLAHVGHDVVGFEIDREKLAALEAGSAPFFEPGLGSRIAATTRDTPALIRACAHGGVFPWWLQGSRVTYTVAPRAAPLACTSASVSAWGEPAFSCQPSPTTSSRCVITHPTRGLGVAVYSPFSASTSARRIIAASNSEKELTCVVSLP